MNKVKHIYQLAVRYADDKRKQFTIERDLIQTDKKLKKSDIVNMSSMNKTDTRVEYLGKLIVAPTNEDNVIEVQYHEKEYIAEKIAEWKNPPDASLHYDDKNFEEKSKELENFINENSQSN